MVGLVSSKEDDGKIITENAFSTYGKKVSSQSYKVSVLPISVLCSDAYESSTLPASESGEDGGS